MNRHVIVAPDRYLPVVNLWWGPPEGVTDWPQGKVPDLAPDLRATRIWMAAAPADDTGPDYACVIAEVYDGDPLQRDRLKMMVDEAVGLDPDDFTEDERFRFRIRPHQQVREEVEGERAIRGCGCPVCSPTLGEFRRGLVALKDLYRPAILLLPGNGLDWSNDTYRREMEVNRFFRQVVMTEGLQRFDRGLLHKLENWFPHMTDHQVGIMTVREDEVFDKRIVEHHLRADLFKVTDTCKLFTRALTNRPQARAVQLALARMQDQDLTFDLRNHMPTGTEGYEEVTRKRTREELELEKQVDAELRAGLEMIGGGGLLLGALDEDG